MSDPMVNVGDLIFNDIDANPFLHELYTHLLHNYSVRRLNVPHATTLEVDIEAALRFADLLSKSTHQQKRDNHRVWAQEIALLCQILYPDDSRTKAYVPAIFSTLGNYPALTHLDATTDTGLLEAAFNAYQAEYLTVPGASNMKFFAPQKQIYDRLTEGRFSFSAPTSLGKSFIMRTFITTQVKARSRQNYAIIVPTKALINETRSKLIADLEDELERANYRIVCAAGDIVLEGDHNFVFVLTPERLLYLLISKPELQFHYVFFDESHKLTGKNSRAPFYYQTVTILQNRPNPPHIIFASPNIPNPEVFLRLVSPDAETNVGRAVATQFSPVVQFKYLIDLDDKVVENYNDHTQAFTRVASVNDGSDNVQTLIRSLTSTTHSGDRPRQTIVFFGGRQRAIDAAQQYGISLPILGDPDLDTLASDIERDVHDDYYLCDLIRKGIAYHIGYLPPAIRERIEGLFRDGKITVLFCTSTLLEGVNLPADNLVITTSRIGRSNMTAVDFKNLIGRVGRIEYNLYGNVFIITGTNLAAKPKAQELLQTKIPVQRLSIESDPKVLSDSLKQEIIATLASGSVEFIKGNETQTQYQMKRKFGLILLRDITEGRASLVRREFESYLDQETLVAIRDSFQGRDTQQDDDITVSLDQADALSAAIRAGLSYPKRSTDGKFDYATTVAFLNQLAVIFNWQTYDPTTLGKTSPDGSELTMIRWYAVILNQWMEGHGLKSIMTRALQNRRSFGRVRVSEGWLVDYDDTIEHRNIVIGEILEVIENVILFSLSNYFLKFSNEYKKINGVEQFENDWYEYVEYGTTNPQTILLQRFGYSRETATFIRHHHDDAVITVEGNSYLNPRLLESQNENVRKETGEIRYNVPEAFVLPGELF